MDPAPGLKSTAMRGVSLPQARKSQADDYRMIIISIISKTVLRNIANYAIIVLIVILGPAYMKASGTQVWGLGSGEGQSRGVFRGLALQFLSLRLERPK